MYVMKEILKGSTRKPSEIWTPCHQPDNADSYCKNPESHTIGRQNVMTSVESKPKMQGLL